MKLTSFRMAVLRAAWVAAILAGAAPVKAQPVHFKELLPFLNLDPPKGWEVAEKPKGTTMKSPMPLTEVEVHFQSGDKTLEVKISDGLSPMAAYLAVLQEMEMEGSEEYTKPIEIRGCKGVETYHYGDKKGEIHLAVGNRFLINIVGHGVEDTAPLREVAAKLDLPKLRELAARQK